MNYEPIETSLDGLLVDSAMLKQLYPIVSNGFWKGAGKEAKLQMMVFAWIRVHYPDVLAVHPENEGYRKPAARYLAKYMGLRSGLPDVMIFRPKAWETKFNAGLAIELKIAPNKIWDNQEKCLKMLEEAGWVTDVCYDFPSTIEAIKNYMEA